MAKQTRARAKAGAEAERAPAGGDEAAAASGGPGSRECVAVVSYLLDVATRASLKGDGKYMHLVKALGDVCAEWGTMEEGGAQQPAEVYSVDASIQVCALATQEALTLRDSNFLVNVPSMVSEIGAAIVMDDPAACEELDALALEARVQVGVACLREDLEESRAVTKDCWDAYQMCLEDHLGPAAVKAVSTDVPNGDAFTKEMTAMYRRLKSVKRTTATAKALIAEFPADKFEAKLRDMVNLYIALKTPLLAALAKDVKEGLYHPDRDFVPPAKKQKVQEAGEVGEELQAETADTGEAKARNGPPTRRPRVDFTEAETDAVVEGFKNHGTDFRAILEEYAGVFNECRQAVDIKDKVKNMKKKYGDKLENYEALKAAAAPRAPPPPSSQQQQQAGTSMQVPSEDVGAAVGPPMAERQAAGGQPSGPKGRRTNKPWSEQEVKALIDAARRFGCRWKTLRAETLGVIEDFRTNVDFKDKWRVLERNGTVSEDDFEKPTRRPS